MHIEDIMKSIPFELMVETEYKEFQIDQAIELAMVDPVEYVNAHLNTSRSFGRIPEIDHNKVFEGVLGRSEEAALHYVNAKPIGKGMTKHYLPCTVWRSCADLLFPQLRRYMDDEVRNAILSHHTDYSVFAVEALKRDLNIDEIKDMLYALACNADTVDIAVNYVRNDSGANPWEFNLVLARCAYTSEEWAWKLVKEFPKTLVFSSAARWHDLAVRMEQSSKVERQVKESCVRQHADIAQKYVNSKSPNMLHIIFTHHPQLRSRILRRSDLEETGYFKRQVNDFHNFQKKIQDKSKQATLKAS